MTEGDPKRLRVALVAQSAERRDYLRSLLAENGIDIAGEVGLLDCARLDLSPATVDVLLIDLDDDAVALLDACLPALDDMDLPVFFNEDGPGPEAEPERQRSFGRRLARKLAEMAPAHTSSRSVASQPEAPPPESRPGTHAASSVPAAAPGPEPEAEAGPGSDLESAETAAGTGDAPEPDAVPPTDVANEARDVPEVMAGPASAEVDTPAPAERPRAHRVWVLGASIGGPQAVKRFLAALPADLPAAFVLAQHVGDGFADLLTEQLARGTALRVEPAREGELVSQGHVLVVPTGFDLHFDDDRRVTLKPLADEVRPYTPSIDTVLSEVAARFGSDVGAIIFSGMGDDGLQGSRAVVDAGGRVWAQDAASCVVSAMPDQVRDAGLVEFSDSPEGLAARLLEHVQWDATADPDSEAAWDAGAKTTG